MALQLTEQKGVRLALEGCAHGELNTIYASVTEACKQKGWPGVDLLIVGGDFQSVRNVYDLNCVSMPAKYREMCDFHEYYSGKRTAPYMTIFVGGNHEASNYLFELYYGGWVAPNIYYLGATNVIRFGPLRIAGLSGIWKGYSYRKNHHERLPYSEDDLKSIYHVRELDVRKLLQIRTQIDIGISHDWPRGIEWKGNFGQLFRFKGHLEEDAKNNQLGSIAAKKVLDRLRPKIWLSAHLHVKYAAQISYSEPDAALQQALNGGNWRSHNANEIELDDVEKGSGVMLRSNAKNDDEIDIDLSDDIEGPTSSAVNGVAAPPINADEVDLELEDDEDGTAPIAPGQAMDEFQVPVQTDTANGAPILSTEEARAALPEAFRRRENTKPEPPKHPPDITNTTTQFLALDKPLPNRQFLQLLEVPVEDNVEVVRPMELMYDREWLAITRSFAIDEPIIVGDSSAETYGGKEDDPEYPEGIDKRRLWIDEQLSDDDLIIPENFEVTAPVYDGGHKASPQYAAVTEYPNPQTARFCKMLEIPNKFEMSESALRVAQSVRDRGEPTVPLPNQDSGHSHRGRRQRGFSHGRGGNHGRGDDRGRGGGGSSMGRGGRRGRFPRGWS
jgi:lariat debranching enzyme